MFESSISRGAAAEVPATVDQPNAAPIPVSGAVSGVGAVETVSGWIRRLSSPASLSAVGGEADAGLVDQLRVLEELKAAASAAQARVAVALDGSIRRAHARAGMPREQQGRGVGAQIALARRESPARGGRILGFANALIEEMPCTLQALSEGRISEWRATLLVRETACLSVEDRRLVDKDIAGDPAELEGLGDRRLIARIRKLTYRIDQQAIVRRAAKAAADRYVSCRPAPDTMTYVTGLLPVAQGVAVYAALSREADSLRAHGDTRGRGQIMADTMVERITGLSRADRVPLEVQLVMTDRTLLSGSAEPAHLDGYGIVPAMWARDAVGTAAAAATGQARQGGELSARGRSDGGEQSPGLWLRRLYTAPATGDLIGMDSKARYAPESLARFIEARDQFCRTPWCGAPIRHRDHIQPHRAGGSTDAGNLQGLCESCNQAKEAPGWKSVVIKHGAGLPATASPPRHTVEITTPTRRRYRSTAPPLPGETE
ncbi:HNH endonuclease [Arthrobacter sp. zg-Y750]|uniref:HNH endonuclease n=1 Tax=Arthrobacter sp. zg-Y750 TaxID=2894189 RepID=UPI001E46FA47|nr:HNH endonuclease signature motif containing protein [Arthrobacter sp. zg-Y750]MCC9177495.1 HNH endonuclease [Arthrobacter sp. zg-Y750]